MENEPQYNEEGEEEGEYSIERRCRAIKSSKTYAIGVTAQGLTMEIEPEYSEEESMQVRGEDSVGFIRLGYGIAL